MLQSDTVLRCVEMVETEKRIEIDSAVQLLVEGNDPRNFFEAFVEHLSIENIQVQDFGGVNELRGFLDALAAVPKFPELVRSIGIVRDAENSARSAFQSVQSSLRNAGLPVPSGPAKRSEGSPTVAAFILSGEDGQGMLETILCESFVADPVNGCINDFFQCVQHLPGVFLRNPDKARAQAYLATRAEPHLSVGVAAKKKYWELEHRAFRGLRDFLRLITEGPV